MRVCVDPTNNNSVTTNTSTGSVPLEGQQKQNQEDQELNNVSETVLAANEAFKNGNITKLSSLIESLQSYRFSPNPSLNTCNKILNLDANSSGLCILQFKIFNYLKLECAKQITSNTERFAFCIKMAEKKEAAIQLANNLDKINLSAWTQNQRLALYEKIMEQGVEAASALVYNLDKMDLSDVTLDQRLALYEKIMEQGGRATSALVSNLNHADLNGMTLEQRLAFYEKIIEQGGANALVNNLDKFNLQPATIEQRLTLYKKIAETEESAAQNLAHNSDKLNLQDATPKQRLDLFQSILEFGRRDAAKGLITNTKSLHIDERLALYTKIAENRTWPSRFLANNSQLDLREATASERLKLYKLIAKQGYSAAEELSLKLNKLGLETSRQRLELCKELLKYGDVGEILPADVHSPLPVEVLAQNFHLMTLDEEDLLSFFDYVIFKGFQKHFARMDLFKAIPNDSVKRQILIDLLRPPSELSVSTSLISYLIGDIGDMEPVFALLNKKSEQQISENEIDALKSFIRKNPKLEILIPTINRIETDITEKVAKDLAKNTEYNEVAIAEIQKEAAFTRSRLMSWLAYAAAVLHELPDERVALFSRQIEGSRIIECIYSYRNPSLRYPLMCTFSRWLKESTQLDKFADWKALTSILIPLTDFDLTPNIRNNLLAQIKNTRSLRETELCSILANLLLAIELNGPYETITDRDQIAQCIIRTLQQPEITMTQMKKGAKPSNKEKVTKEEQEKGEAEKTKGARHQIKNDLVALTNILQIFGKEKFLQVIKSGNRGYNSIFIAEFKHCFNIDDHEIANFEERYQITFGQFRDPIALFTYSHAIESLANNEKIAVKAALKTYVCSVLMGTFQDVRYSPENSAHLQQVFSARPGFDQLWRTSIGSKDLSSNAMNEAEVKQSKEQASSRYRVVDTDDPCDLLMIGTEVKNSCQSVHNASQNKALAGYLLNGEVRAIAIKQGDKLVARAIIRLMWDEKNQRPVLLQEQLYSNVKDDAMQQAINDLAKEKAKQMGICLVSNNIGAREKLSSEELYNGTVEFLGGFAPFIYFDSSGAMKQGQEKVSVSHCFTLYDPTI